MTEQALKSAKTVVVLWSQRSVESRWVRAEATLADRNRTLVPARIEICDLPIMFELTQTADLSHWQGGAGDPAWRAFLGDVRADGGARRDRLRQRERPGGEQHNRRAESAGARRTAVLQPLRPGRRRGTSPTAWSRS